MAPGSTSPRCASTSSGDDVRRDRLERHRPDGHPARPRVPRGPRDHGLVPARPQPVGRLRHGRTADGEKRTVLIDFVATLARLLTRRGNRVGAMFFGERGRTGRSRPPAAGSRSCRIVSDLMARAAARARAVHGPRAAPRGRPSPDQAPLDGRDRVRTSSACPAGRSRSTCSTAATRCSRSASSTRARSTLPDIGPIVVEDAETGEQLYVDTHDAKFRRRFEAAAAAREAELARRVRAGRRRRRDAVDRRRPGPRDRAHGDAAQAPAAEPRVSFLSPQLLLLLVLVPLGVLAAGRIERAPARPGSRAARARLREPAGRAGARRPEPALARAAAGGPRRRRVRRPRRSRSPGRRRRWRCRGPRARS